MAAVVVIEPTVPVPASVASVLDRDRPTVPSTGNVPALTVVVPV